MRSSLHPIAICMCFTWVVIFNEVHVRCIYAWNGTMIYRECQLNHRSYRVIVLVPRCWLDDELFNLNIIVCRYVWTSNESCWLTLKSYPSLNDWLPLVWHHNYIHISTFLRSGIWPGIVIQGNWFNSKLSHTCTQYHNTHVVLGPQCYFVMCRLAMNHKLCFIHYLLNHETLFATYIITINKLLYKNFCTSVDLQIQIWIL